MESYRGWLVRYDPTPIPIRDFDWTATGPDFDASWEGEEDGYVSSGGQANASTRAGLIAEIDAWFEENASADTRPEGGDSTEIEAPFTSGAVPKADAQPPVHKKEDK